MFASAGEELRKTSLCRNETRVRSRNAARDLSPETRGEIFRKVSLAAIGRSTYRGLSGKVYRRFEIRRTTLDGVNDEC